MVLTLVRRHVRALRDEQAYAFLALHVAVGVTYEAVDCEADKPHAVLVPQTQIDHALRLRIRQKILHDGDVPESACTGEAVRHQLYFLRRAQS